MKLLNILYIQDSCYLLTSNLDTTRVKSNLTRRLSISSKISYGYLLALSVALLGTSAGFMIGGHYQQQATDLKEHAQEKLDLLHRLQTNIQQEQIEQLDLIALISEPELLYKKYFYYLVFYDQANQAFSELNFYVISKTYKQEADRDGLPRFLQTYKDTQKLYLQQVKELLRKIDPANLKFNKSESIQQLLLNFTTSPIGDKLDKLSDDLAKVIDTSYQEHKRAEAALIAAEALRFRIITASLLLSIVIATLLAIYTSRAVAHPIRVVTDVARRVSTEANFDLQAPVTTEDEVGVLATSLNQLILKVKHLLAEHKVATQAQQQSDSILRQVIDLVPHYIYAKNADGQYILANEAVAKTFGVSVKEVLNHKDEELVKSTEQVRQFREADLQVINNRQPQYILEETVTDTEGNVRIVQTTKLPLFVAGSEVPAVLGISIDITERKFAETIRSSGDALLTIINDILDFSKIESGKLDLEEQPFELRSCVEESLDLVATKAAEKKLELAYLFAPGTPNQVVGDVTRLRQILVNLLGNAVKFTHSGEVMVSVTAQNLAEAGEKGRGGGGEGEGREGEGENL
jgi:PAS domain S-box-containing protein